MKINNDALLATALGAITVMNMTGKKVPEWLTLISMGVAVVGVINSSKDIIIRDTKTETVELSGIRCSCQNTPRRLY